MHIKEIINEGRNNSVIVVDVQPEYTASPPVSNPVDWNERLMDFLNKQGPILMFVNAEDQGMSRDTVASIKDFWEDNGFNPERWSQTEIVDKGYGYFRSWMDRGEDPSSIIKVIREMYRQKVSDSRDLFGGENHPDYDENMRELVGHAFRPFDLDDSLIVNWTSVAQLKRFSGSYLVGGSRNECLREVELLMNAFNIRYKRVEEFVYG
jgi:hypothetical protein